MNVSSDDIFLITQFYIDSNNKRLDELLFCLKKNVTSGFFKKIILINEKIYTSSQLGLSQHEMKYIKQINNENRMTYQHAFSAARDMNLIGYIVISNSDIFFDNTILNIYKSCLSTSKSLYALVRFEYKGEKNLNECSLHSNTSMSQDVWIIHNKYLPTCDEIINLNIFLGCRGCDNAIAYKLNNLGYVLKNEPYTVRTYHNHNSFVRSSPHRKNNAPRPYLNIPAVIPKTPKTPKAKAVNKSELSEAKAVNKSEPFKTQAVNKPEPSEALVLNKSEPFKAKAKVVNKSEPFKVKTVDKSEPFKAKAVNKSEPSVNRRSLRPRSGITNNTNRCRRGLRTTKKVNMK